MNTTYIIAKSVSAALKQHVPINEFICTEEACEMHNFAQLQSSVDDCGRLYDIRISMWGSDMNIIADVYYSERAQDKGSPREAVLIPLSGGGSTPKVELDLCDPQSIPEAIRVLQRLHDQKYRRAMKTVPRD